MVNEITRTVQAARVVQSELEWLLSAVVVDGRTEEELPKNRVKHHLLGCRSGRECARSTRFVSV